MHIYYRDVVVVWSCTFTINVTSVWLGCSSLISKNNGRSLCKYVIHLKTTVDPTINLTLREYVAEDKWRHSVECRLFG